MTDDTHTKIARLTEELAVARQERDDYRELLWDERRKLADLERERCVQIRALEEMRAARDAQVRDATEADVDSWLHDIMTPEDWEDQRRSFAYGNVAVHDPKVTRKDIDLAADRIEAMVCASCAGSGVPRRDWYPITLVCPGCGGSGICTKVGSNG